MLNLSRQQWAGVWCAAILMLSVGAVAAGAGITVGNGVLALLALVAPPSVMMLIWRPLVPTVTELLYDPNAPAPDDWR